MLIKMKKKFVLSAFASVFLLSAVIGSQLIVAVAAQGVGVSEGDWAEYDCDPSTNGTLYHPSWNTTWSMSTVLEISGTNITYQGITRYANTTEVTTITVLDVATGQANTTYNSGSFIAANLTQGDLIYTNPSSGAVPQGATINETIWGTYPVVGYVEVNHLNITSSWTVDTTVVTMSLNLYWYRATGMLTEVSIYILEQPDVGPATWSKLEMVTFDIIPEFPPALILPLLMIASLAAVWLGKTIWSTKKLIKKPSHCA